MTHTFQPYKLAIALSLCSGACTLPDVKVIDKSNSAQRGSDAGNDRNADAEVSARDGAAETAKSSGGSTARSSGGSPARAALGGRGAEASDAGTAADSSAGRATEQSEPAPRRAWSKSVKLELGTKPTNLQYGIDMEGRVIALWNGRDEADKPSVLSSRYLDAKWTAAVKVAAEIEQIGSLALLATDRTGRGAALVSRAPVLTTMDAAWTLSDVNTDVFVANFSQDGTWGSATLLGKVGFIGSGRSLVMNDVGIATAVARQFLENSFSNWAIWSSQYQSDAGWSESRNFVTPQPADDSSTEANALPFDVPGDMDLAINHGGRTMAVWERGDGVYATETGGGVRIEQLEELAPPGNSAAWVHIGSDDYDRSIATWTVFDGTRTNLHSRRYIRGEGWGPLTELEDNDADARNPGLAVDKQGNAIVVWAQSDGTTTAIWYNRYQVGQGWGGPLRVEPKNSASNPGDAFIAMDEGGDVLAIWTDLGDVRAARYLVDSGWEPAIRVSQDDAKPHADDPTLHISVSPTGIGMATWRDQNEAYWYSRFE